MKKKLIISNFLIFITLISFAGEITVYTAEQTAKNYYYQQSGIKQDNIVFSYSDFNLPRSILIYDLLTGEIKYNSGKPISLNG